MPERHDDLDALLLLDAHAVDQVLLGHANRTGLARRRVGELVHELVDPRRAEGGARGSADEQLLPGELHRVRLGLTRTSPRTMRSRLLTTLAVGERLDDVLADRVEVSVVVPRVEDVPLVDAAVHRVHRRGDSAEMALPVRVAEARHRRPAHLAADDLDVLAARDLGAARVAAEVDVHVLARRLVPEEADEVAAVLLDRDAVVPLAADLRVDRARHPRRAVDGLVEPVREPLPAGLPALRAASQASSQPQRRACSRSRSSPRRREPTRPKPLLRQAKHQEHVIAGKSPTRARQRRRAGGSSRRAALVASPRRTASRADSCSPPRARGPRRRP